MLPFCTVAGGDAGHGRSPRRRPWLAALLGLALLALAPALARAQGADTVVVSWTAPGDDGRVGTAAVYDLRVSESEITAQNFDAATPVSGLPAPLRSGTLQRVTVRGLTRGTPYYFAIRTADDQGNWSPLSNVVRWDWIMDSAPPAPPRNAVVERGPDGVLVSWAANAEADLAGYNVYRRDPSGGEAVRINAELVTDTEFLDATAPTNVSALWYEVTAVDMSGNESGHSTGTKLEVVTALTWALRTGYPNPSRVGQTVRFPVVVPADASGDVTVDILDAGGRRVRRLPLSNPVPGIQEVAWDGRNDAGRDTAPGVYRGWLVVGDTRSSARILRVP